MFAQLSASTFKSTLITIKYYVYEEYNTAFINWCQDYAKHDIEDFMILKNLYILANVFKKIAFLFNKWYLSDSVTSKIVNTTQFCYRGRRSFSYVTHNKSVCEYGSHPFLPPYSSLARCCNWLPSPPNILGCYLNFLFYCLCCSSVHALIIGTVKMAPVT